MSALAARLRAWSARHPRVYWVVVVVVVIWSVAAWWRVDADAQRRRAAWGASAEVWVASADHAIGDPVRAEPLLAPRAVIPDGAVTSSPSGRAAQRVLHRGEIVLGADVEPTAIAHGIGPGEVALTVRPDPAGPFAVGDAIVVLAPDGAAIDGHVVAVGDDDITISVPLDQAATVAQALLDGAVVVALAAADR